MSGRVVSSRQFSPLYESQMRPLYENDYGSARVSSEGYVSNLSVTPSRRGEGHGTQLMKQITQHADTIGQSLKLNAQPELHEWYKKMGFEVTGADVYNGSSVPRLERKPKGI